MNLKDKNLYYVGGFVRDDILGIKSIDIDYCYEGNAIEFAKTASLNIIKVNPSFGTVRVLFNNKEIDIASTRLESYPKIGHLPQIKKIACPLKEDLNRRDFTINAIAKNTLTGEIIDPFNGLEDIKNKKLRVLHSKSFIEDPSRIIRGLKFACRFKFDLEKNTLKLQEEYLNNINYDLSFHRLKKELKETFTLSNPEVYNLFIKQGIYKLLNKDQNELYEKLNKVNLSKFNLNYPYMIYLGLFNLENFELTKDEKNIVNSFNKMKNIIPHSNNELYNLFIDKPLESILMYSLAINKEIAFKFLDELSQVKIQITGKDLENLAKILKKDNKLFLLWFQFYILEYFSLHHTYDLCSRIIGFG